MTSSRIKPESSNLFIRITRRLVTRFTAVESRTQGSRPRPPRLRTQKKSEAKAKNRLSKDRPSRGQRQECSRPRLMTKDTSRKCSPKKEKRKKKVFAQKSRIFRKISGVLPPSEKKGFRAENRKFFEKF